MIVNSSLLERAHSISQHYTFGYDFDVFRFHEKQKTFLRMKINHLHHIAAAREAYGWM